MIIYYIVVAMLSFVIGYSTSEWLNNDCIKSLVKLNELDDRLIKAYKEYIDILEEDIKTLEEAELKEGGVNGRK